MHFAKYFLDVNHTFLFEIKIYQMYLKIQIIALAIAPSECHKHTCVQREAQWYVYTICRLNLNRCNIVCMDIAKLYTICSEYEVHVYGIRGMYE